MFLNCGCMCLFSIHALFCKCVFNCKWFGIVLFFVINLLLQPILALNVEQLAWFAVVYWRFQKWSVFLGAFCIDWLLSLEFILIFESWDGACCFLTSSQTYFCDCFLFSASYKCIELQCAVWVVSAGVNERAPSVIEASSDRRVNWMMDALMWLMGHFYSQFWIWVRSSASPYLSCAHQSITSLPQFPVFSPCFSPSLQPNTFSYSSLSYLCLHLAPFFGISVSAISGPFPSV